MKLETLEDWRAFVDLLQERGAVGVKISIGGDGVVSGLECALRPRIEVQAGVTRRPVAHDEHQKIEAKPAPAGLGYLGY